MFVTIQSSIFTAIIDLDQLLRLGRKRRIEIEALQLRHEPPSKSLAVAECLEQLILEFQSRI